MTPPPSSEPGGLATFNIHHAFPEALVRGMRSSFLKDSDYHHLSQCETLDDVRLNLSETDYAEPLADMPTLMPSSLQKVAVDKVRPNMRNEMQKEDSKRVGHFPAPRYVERGTNSTRELSFSPLF
jgi:hypothetical protein